VAGAKKALADVIVIADRDSPKWRTDPAVAGVIARAQAAVGSVAAAERSLARLGAAAAPPRAAAGTAATAPEQPYQVVDALHAIVAAHLARQAYGLSHDAAVRLTDPEERTDALERIVDARAKAGDYAQARMDADQWLDRDGARAAYSRMARLRVRRGEADAVDAWAAATTDPFLRANILLGAAGGLLTETFDEVSAWTRKIDRRRLR
jgi:hypothetical protein